MKFSKNFNLNKTQAELDFVDINLDTDIPLFIDPYALSKRIDIWSTECHNIIVAFFQAAIDAIRKNDDIRARNMLYGLSEPNDTRLGLSKGKPQGKGVSGKQANDIYDKLRVSSAVRTGFISELSDCELMVDGIARDKISDITTKIIKKKLIEYTIDQCLLWGVDLQRDVHSGFFWNETLQQWDVAYFDLPCYGNERIILVPKAIVRFNLCYEYQDYYNSFILTYLQDEHISANSSLVKTLKSGVKVVYKKDLKEHYPCRKQFIYDFSRNHPEVLNEYKKARREQIIELFNEEISPDLLEEKLAIGLINILKSIKAGAERASDYHNLMIGALEFIFYPGLIYPKKEKEIHEGRKRIDIVFTNSARLGFFQILKAHQIPCLFLMFECKNYRSDPANPELDQISGRFSQQRGKVGFLVCRNLTDKNLFIQRCKDTASDDRGIIIPLDDHDIIQLLLMRKDHNENSINQFLNDRFRKIVMG